MISLFFNILLVWLILGVTAYSASWVVFHKPENLEDVSNKLGEFAEDIDISKSDCKVIAYSLAFVFGFILVPFVIIRKIVRFFGGTRDSEQ